MINIPDNIYPKDEAGQLLCPRCRKIVKDCACPSIDPVPAKAKKFIPVVRLDKSGRQGKVVTIIDGLPRNEDYLKGLAKTIKSNTGSGGTFYLSEQSGVIEIQGDHRGAIKEIFKKLFPAKP